MLRSRSRNNMTKDFELEAGNGADDARRYESLHLGETGVSERFSESTRDPFSYTGRWQTFRDKHLWLKKVPWHGVATGILLLTTVIFATGWSACSSAEEEYAKFLVVGDWGRQGQYNQTQVADRMNKVAGQIHADFIISVGDNFYPSGLSSPGDPLFLSSFSSVYSGSHLQIPWLSILGNHDYGDTSGPEKCADGGCPSPLNQLDVRLAGRDRRWFCARAFKRSFGGGELDLFFIDTVPAISAYRKDPWATFEGGVLEQSWGAQLRELEASLAASKARWKIAFGHHPVRSNALHGNAAELIAQLEPIFKKYGVQAYFAGHDHSLEHIHQSGPNDPHYIISGGGSKCDRGFSGTTDSLFQYSYSGFVAVEIDHEEMDVDFYGIEGSAPLYSMEFDLTDFARKRSELWSAEGL